MANFGFIIDNRRCIGCHACTVACKSEHNVPIGVNRTWVKYVEKGEFPNTRRLFSVMRCNHCDDAPCVEICPVTALYRRSDGIVDFDNRRCIGCKACMQACPYDALYIDPQNHTAAKCNYCAHRIDIGLEPACVVVCPTQAIIAGDLDNPGSHISQLKSRHQVSARKVEKGTAPKLYYIDGDVSSLDPLATEPIDTSVWSQQTRGVGQHAQAHPLDRLGQLLSLGESSDFIGSEIESQVREHLAVKQRRAYDAPQKGVPWGWPVTAYLWTKAAAAGLVILPILTGLAGWAQISGVLEGIGIAMALLFLALTGLLLVVDLDQPKRFLYVLLRPQWRSWLVRGAYVITLFALTLTLQEILILSGSDGFAMQLLRCLNLGLAVMAATYTAFLFAQAKGRDSWQSPVLPVQMAAHAVALGSAFYAIASLFSSSEWATVVRIGLAISLLAHLVCDLSELTLTHGSKASANVARSIMKGRFQKLFWLNTAGGIAIPMAICLGGVDYLLPLAGILTMGGVYISQHILVYAGQQNSLS